MVGEFTGNRLALLQLQRHFAGRDIRQQIGGQLMRERCLLVQQFPGEFAGGNGVISVFGRGVEEDAVHSLEGQQKRQGTENLRLGEAVGGHPHRHPDAQVRLFEVFQSLEDTDVPVDIREYIQQEVVQDEVEEETVFVFNVEEKPTFNGGDANKFSKWVNARLVYPEVAKENGVEGRVTLQFTIDKEGRLGDVKVLSSPDETLAREAVRVVSSSPKWKPGKQRDRTVKVSYTFPVIYRLR